MHTHHIIHIYIEEKKNNINMEKKLKLCSLFCYFHFSNQKNIKKKYIRNEIGKNKSKFAE
jgi:hypothetical protein